MSNTSPSVLAFLAQSRSVGPENESIKSTIASLEGEDRLIAEAIFDPDAASHEAKQAALAITKWTDNITKSKNKDKFPALERVYWAGVSSLETRNKRIRAVETSLRRFNNCRSLVVGKHYDYRGRQSVLNDLAFCVTQQEWDDLIWYASEATAEERSRFSQSSVKVHSDGTMTFLGRPVFVESGRKSLYG